MKKIITLLEICQPIGYFYVGKIDSSTLSSISYVKTRKITEGVSEGTQRELDSARVKAISQYCEDPDATFPTPFVLAINSNDILHFEEENGIFRMEFDDNRKIAEIIDGQHRIEGIKANKQFNTELMIVIMFDLTSEEKAYVFSTINSNQRTVPKSLIYDLFEVSNNRSPYKTCHEIARIMNSSSNSPFFKRLKMLGRKESENEILSQGAFVSHLLTLITDNADKDTILIKNREILRPNENKIFRRYFIKDEDQIILRILYNYFGAIKEVFYEEWTNPESIFVKTTGFGGFIKSLPAYYKAGLDAGNLSREFFLTQMIEAKKHIQDEKIEFTLNEFGSSESGQKKFSEHFKPRNKKTNKE